jgi:hypothetical protein
MTEEHKRKISEATRVVNVINKRMSKSLLMR